MRLEERATTKSARHRGQQKYQLTLLNAVKPHTKPVSSLAVDREGKVLASGSKDNTVFFLNVQDQYSPIGFIHTPAPVTTMRWSSGNKVKIIALVSEFSSWNAFMIPTSQNFEANIAISNFIILLYHIRIMLLSLSLSHSHSLLG